MPTPARGLRRAITPVEVLSLADGARSLAGVREPRRAITPVEVLNLADGARSLAGARAALDVTPSASRGVVLRPAAVWAYVNSAN